MTPSLTLFPTPISTPISDPCFRPLFYPLQERARAASLAVEAIVVRVMKVRLI